MRSRRSLPTSSGHPAIEPGVEGKATTYRGHDRPERLGGIGGSVLLLSQIDFTAPTTGIAFSQDLGELIQFREGEDRSRPRLLTHAEASEPPGWSG
jgi:hypothetical protein